jgi:osmotically-inducible protein OsmY
MNDRELQEDIVAELDFDPTLNANKVGVAVNGGVVTLTGRVRSLAEKSAAENAVRRVDGVRAIVEEMDVSSDDDDMRGDRPTDEELAHRAVNILQWDNSVPNERIAVTVRNGTVTLNGDVAWQFQRTAAEDAIRRLSGITDVLNNILIRPRVQAGNIQKIVEEALRRNSKVNQKAIRVSVRDPATVVLEGTVRSLDEKKAVEDAAWCALGIEAVENRLTLSGAGS